MTTPDLGPAAPADIFSDSLRWGDLQQWRQAAVDLHSKGPMQWIERQGFTPFWAVIGHAALLEIESRSDVFKNEPEAVLGSDEAFAERTMEIKTLVHMDEPQHGDYRRLTAAWFKLPLDGGSISVSGHNWPEWNCGPCSQRLFRDSSPSSWPVKQPLRSQPLLEATRPCLSVLN